MKSQSPTPMPMGGLGFGTNSKIGTAGSLGNIRGDSNKGLGTMGMGMGMGLERSNIAKSSSNI